MSLPRPDASQAFCEVSALAGGFVDLPDGMFITSGDLNVVTRLPCLAFLLQHNNSGKRIIFDLGIRKDFKTGYTPGATKWINTIHAEVPQDVVESLALGNLAPDDIDAIILSHLHWDHVGNPALFPKATFVLGGEGETLLRTGFPTNPDSSFAEDLVPIDRSQFLKSDDWAPIGPFPHAFDYLGDGSLYIIDSPGHLPGHINILARTSVDGAWIYLAGDSFHHAKLLSGEAEVACGHPGLSCAHVDKAVAVEHISRTRALTAQPRVKVITAHDGTCYRENPDGTGFWPGCIPPL